MATQTMRLCKADEQIIPSQPNGPAAPGPIRQQLRAQEKPEPRPDSAGRRAGSPHRSLAQEVGAESEPRRLPVECLPGKSLPPGAPGHLQVQSRLKGLSPFPHPSCVLDKDITTGFKATNKRGKAPLHSAGRKIMDGYGIPG